MKANTEELKHKIERSSKASFRDILKSIDDKGFCERLSEIIVEKGLSKSEIINKTNLDRPYAYQIMNGTKVGTQDKILQLCLALGCDLATTNQLLILSKESILYAKIKRDAVVIFAISHQYSVMETNAMLEEQGLKILE